MIMTASSSNTTSLLSHLENQMEEAIEVLDVNIKRELIAAMEIVPHVVQTETDRIKFLRTEGFDPIKAAHRLAMYWKHRKSVFGDRWLLPMVQNGTGALSKKIVEIVQSGFITLVSSSPSPLCICDTSRLPRPLDDEMAACVFYFGTIGSNEATQTKGSTLIHVVTGKGPQSLDMSRLYWNIMHEALPFKVNDVFVVPTHDVGRQHLIDYIAFQTSKLIDFRSGRRSEIIKGETKEHTLQLLERRDISPRSLPTCLGGYFGREQFHHWTMMRLRVEDSLSSVSVSPSRDYTFRGSTDLLVKRKKSTEEDDKAEQEYVRKRNALYSRRLYYKKKLEMIALPERCEALKEVNGRLKAENDRLIALLNEAQRVVSDYRLAEEAQSVLEFFHDEEECDQKIAAQPRQECRTQRGVWFPASISDSVSRQATKSPDWQDGRIQVHTQCIFDLDIYLPTTKDHTDPGPRGE